MKSIVIRFPNWIGDAVMATPVLTDAHKVFPEASITIVAQPHIATLLQGLPAKIQPMTPTIIQEIRQQQYDVGLLLTNSFSSAWLFRRAHVKNITGFAGHWRRFLLHTIVSDPVEKEHEVLTYRRILSPYGHGEAEPCMQLVVSEEERQQARLLLQQYIPNDAPYFVIHPGAAYGSAKCWPVDKFRRVVQHFSSKGLFSVCLGTADVTQLAETITQGLPNTISLAGKTSIRELMALIAESTAVLSNDSGPMHIAAALQKPVVALFGSTDPFLTGPWKKGIVCSHPPCCSPCFKRVCPYHMECMQAISVEEVITAMEAVL